MIELSYWRQGAAANEGDRQLPNNPVRMTSTSAVDATLSHSDTKVLKIESSLIGGVDRPLAWQYARRKLLFDGGDHITGGDP